MSDAVAAARAAHTEAVAALAAARVAHTEAVAAALDAARQLAEEAVG